MKYLVSSFSSGLLLRTLGAVFNVLALPITLAVLGQERFAASATLLGLAAWLMIGSLGLGNATAMTVANTRNESEVDQDALWQGIVSGLLSIGVVSSVGLLCVLLTLAGVPSGISESIATELRLSAFYCLAAFSIASLGTIFEGLFMGLLRNAYCNYVRVTCQVLAIGLLLVVPNHFRSILSVAVVMTAAPSMAALWFISVGVWQFPPPRNFVYEFTRSLPVLKQGLGFLTSSLAILFYGGGSLPLFAATFGPAELATAGVMARFIQLYCSILAVFLLPLGVFLRKAIRSRDRASLRTILLSVGGALACLAIVTAASLNSMGSKLLFLWTRNVFPQQGYWFLPLSIFLIILTWSYFWAYISFATRGSKTAAILASAEIVL